MRQCRIRAGYKLSLSLVSLLFCGQRVGASSELFTRSQALASPFAPHTVDSYTCRSSSPNAICILTVFNGMDSHDFKFSELRPNAGSNKQPYIRFLIFFRKRADISQEKFHTWWRSVHADLAIAVAGFGGHCMRYVQVRVPAFIQSKPWHRCRRSRMS